MSRIYQGGIPIGNYTFIFDMDTFETRTSWGHVGELTVVHSKGYDTIEKVYHKIRYQNRTWERFEGQSLMFALIDKLYKSTKKELSSEIETLKTMINKADDARRVKSVNLGESTVTERLGVPNDEIIEFTEEDDIDIYGVESGKSLWVSGEQFIMPEQNGQGYYYKSESDYYDGGLGYVPEYAFEGVKSYRLDIKGANQISKQILNDYDYAPWYKVSDIYEKDSGYTRENMLKLVEPHYDELVKIYTNKNITLEEITDGIFEMLDWQYPDSIIWDILSMHEVDENGLEESTKLQESEQDNFEKKAMTYLKDYFGGELENIFGSNLKIKLKTD